MCPLVQRRLHDMYQSYYEADPKSRSPPIPTAFLRTPGSRTGDSQAPALWAGLLARALCAKCMPDRTREGDQIGMHGCGAGDVTIDLQTYCIMSCDSGILHKGYG